jgi:hypothetical protein
LLELSIGDPWYDAPAAAAAAESLPGDPYDEAANGETGPCNGRIGRSWGTGG